MNRQYIGARYVPKFSDINNGVWDNTYSYEPLEIVKHGNDYYTSKKPVPTGVAITNTNYWEKTGDYNGAISGLDGRVTDLEGDNATNTARINHIELNYSRDMKDRVFLFLGDSYDVITDYLTTVGNSLKCKSFTKRSETGAGFVKKGSALPTYYKILTELSPLTDTEKADVTDVVFCVAVGNDLHDTYAELSDAITQMDTYLRTNLSKLRNIHLLPVGWCTALQTTQENMYSNMSIYSHHVPGLGWKYVDCTRVMKSGAYIEPTDEIGYHPTTAGGAYIAQCVTEAILTGSVSFETTNPAIEYQFTATPSKGSISNPSGGTITFVGQIKSDGRLALMLNDFPLVLSGIDLSTSDTFVDIDLVPTVANKIPIPIELNAFYPLTIYGDDCFKSAGLIQRTQGNIKIRIFAWTHEPVTNKTVYIVPNSDWII